MKTFFKSLKLKYSINVLLIVIFGITAQTGLFDRGGDHGGKRRHQGREMHAREEYSMDENNENYVPGDLEFAGAAGFNPKQGGEKENTHVYLGLTLIALMLVHVIHHWSWFKRMISMQHLMKNKLLSVTVVFFLAMAISGIILWTEIIPREVLNFKEIHEITSQVLIGLILIHIVQRFKWYINSTGKLFKTKTTPVQA